MITFELYQTLSYAVALTAAVILTLRLLYVYLINSDNRLLDCYRIQHVSLTETELALYNQLSKELSTDVEILCKVNISDTFPKETCQQFKLQNGRFDFVVCQRKTNKIMMIVQVGNAEQQTTATAPDNITWLCAAMGVPLHRRLPDDRPAIQQPDKNSEEKKKKYRPAGTFSRRRPGKRHPILKI